MNIRKYAYSLVLILVVCSGCVTRTGTRSKNIMEVPVSRKGSSSWDTGMVSEQKRTIWFWQADFWQP